MKQTLMEWVWKAGRSSSLLVSSFPHVIFICHFFFPLPHHLMISVLIFFLHPSGQADRDEQWLKRNKKMLHTWLGIHPFTWLWRRPFAISISLRNIHIHLLPVLRTFLHCFHCNRACFMFSSRCTQYVSPHCTAAAWLSHAAMNMHPVA